MSGAHSAGTSTEDERKSVLACLEHVLEFGFSAASDRQKRLLQYLVTEELEGRGDRLKALAIATDVLGRSADFDPQTDSIVRVEMARLRRTLELYYATEGAKDPMRFKFEKGSYRPKFEAMLVAEKTPETRSKFFSVRWILGALAVIAFGGIGITVLLYISWPIGKPFVERPISPVVMSRGPRVAVAPFAFSSDTPGLDYLAAGIQGELVGILSEFDWLTVFPLLADQAIDKGPPNVTGRVNYIVRGTAQAANGKLAVWVLLADGETGAVLWSNRYESAVHATDLVDLQRKIATSIATDIGRPRGLIVNFEKTRLAADSFRTSESFDCYFHSLFFFETFDRDDYAKAYSCAQAVNKTTNNTDANALALLALLDLTGQILDYQGTGSVGHRASVATLAEQAFRLNNVGFLPRMASYAAALCESDEERFSKISSLSLRDYPNNPAVLYDVAQRMILGLRKESDGNALLERAYNLNSLSESSYGVLKAFEAFRHGENAETILKNLQLSAPPVDPPLVLLEMGLRTKAGDKEGAQRVRRSLEKLGFAQRSDYLGLIERECWTDEVKNTARQLLSLE
ncbi:MAG TPA: hypothetical protein VEK34_11600 [Methylocella sp.]|nr:hypothetical protein [Methylocella sp.]